MASEERYLWLIYYKWDGESRMWWAYFKDWLEVQACLAKLMGTFPDLALQKLEACQEGLLVLDQYYSATSSQQERDDALFKEMIGERDRQFFPLAPLACDYLASFQVGLDNEAPREHGEALSHARSVVR